MSEAELIQAITPVLGALDWLGVPHYIGGSVASSVYGVARTTLDADLVAVLREEHVPGLAGELAGKFYLSESMMRSAIKNESSFNVIHLPTMFKVDIFVAKRRPFDLTALGRIRKDTLGESEQLAVYLASPEDVVLNKLEWYRLGDEVAERQWHDVLGVLKVQQKLLDRSYLELWADELGIGDLLKRALSEANFE